MTKGLLGDHISLNILKYKNKKCHIESYVSVITPRPSRILLLDSHDDPLHPVILYGSYDFI